MDWAGKKARKKASFMDVGPKLRTTIWILGEFKGFCQDAQEAFGGDIATLPSRGHAQTKLKERPCRRSMLSQKGLIHIMLQAGSVDPLQHQG